MPPRPTPAGAVIGPVLAALLLTACGGGSSDGGKASAPGPATTSPPAATPVPPPPSPPSPPAAAAPAAPSGGSTALKDNAPPANANFSNFTPVRVSVPVDTVAFSGTRRFVKISRPDGAVVFLGEVAPGVPFSVTVDAPLGLGRFLYEIFSESADDAIVRGEVTL